MEFAFDVFVSYRQQEPDKTWVKNKLIPALEAAGLKVFVDYKNFKLGASLIKEMERGVVNSRYTVAVLSPKYLASNFTEFENLISEHLGLLNAQTRLISVMIEYCAPRLSIQSKLWLDLTSDELFKDNMARLIEALKETTP